ncbi:hypothetical protein GCM10025880_03150 [Methylorubrum aminovorans]|nr:hypothetical protein GCM10025880_03150 [Methylorubrum aminovorans]
MVANIAVELLQLGIGEAVIGLADRHQLLTLRPLAPAAEGVVRVERRALSVAALGVHHHRIDDVGLALPLPPRPLRAARQVGAVEAFQHHALDGVGIRASAGGSRVGAGARDLVPGREGDERREVDAGMVELPHQGFQPGPALGEGQSAQVLALG